MKSLRGKTLTSMTPAALAARIAGYRTVALDIGTGDGRFVQHIARQDAARFVVGVDACQEPLRRASQRATLNTLFLIANAAALPPALAGVATQISINFPWGSLLAGLLTGDSAIMAGIVACGQPGALVEIRLNGGALATAGTTLTEGGMAVRYALRAAGLRVEQPVLLAGPDLRACPTTWAQRLAFGRDPRAMLLRAYVPADARVVGASEMGAETRHSHAS